MHIVRCGPWNHRLCPVPVPELRGGPDRTLRTVQGSVRVLSVLDLWFHGTVRDSVGSVAVTFRILPEGPEADLEEIKARIEKALDTSLRGIEEKPVGFGIKAIVAVAIVDDASGAMERLEGALMGIPGVSSVDTEDVTLV